MRANSQRSINMTVESRSYPLPEYSIPALPLHHHLEDLAEVQAFLKSLGIRTQNTRIERYIRYLEQAVNGKQPDESQIFKNAVVIHAFKALLIGSFTCYEKLMSSCGSSKVSKRECPKEQMEN